MKHQIPAAILEETSLNYFQVVSMFQKSILFGKVKISTWST